MLGILSSPSKSEQLSDIDAFEETEEERLLRQKLKKMAPYDFWTFMKSNSTEDNEKVTKFKVEEQSEGQYKLKRASTMGEDSSYFQKTPSNNVSAISVLKEMEKAHQIHGSEEDLDQLSLLLTNEDQSSINRSLKKQRKSRMLYEYHRHVIEEAAPELEESGCKSLAHTLNFSGMRDSSNKKSRSQIHRSFFVDSNADINESNATLPIEYLQDIAESENEGTGKNTAYASPDKYIGTPNSKKKKNIVQENGTTKEQQVLSVNFDLEIPSKLDSKESNIESSEEYQNGRAKYVIGKENTH